MKITFVHDIVEENGKTIKENNLGISHAIPVGSLVEVKFDSWFGGGACMKAHARLWVISHDRDCDGTPLYSLSRWKDPEFANKVMQYYETGFAEDSLTRVDITPDIESGENALVGENVKGDL